MNKCCEHRSADHKYVGASPPPGALCSIPGCPCKGWVPRKGTKLRGAGLKRSRSGRVLR